LVVDDNPVMRSGLSAMLRRIGDVTDVIEAPDAETALSILDAKEPAVDLVFLDIRLPGMDGLTALQHIEGTPVVMLTGSDDAESIRTALERGARGFLVNSDFTSDELITAVSQCPRGEIVLSPAAAERMRHLRHLKE